MPKQKERKTMNRKLKRRVVISMVVILACTVSLASAPLAKSTGDVQVRLQNGNLVIRGDEQDNNIIITESGISGRAGTSVNGERHIFIPEGVTNDIIIDMKGGDDFVRVELPGTNFAIPHDLEIRTGSGNDIIELLQVRAPNETRIDTGNGHDIVFVDGVLGVNEYIRSEFSGRFELETDSGEDLFEFHHTIFHSEVDVSLGSGIDGACNTEDSEFLMPDQANFNGGAPHQFPGDGFVAPSIQFTNITDFETFPDDCSHLGGRFQ
jgi:hypothetical protein